MRLAEVMSLLNDYIGQDGCTRDEWNVDEFYKPTCNYHGAMLAVDKFGMYRCSVCHIGVKRVRRTS